MSAEQITVACDVIEQFIQAEFEGSDLPVNLEWGSGNSSLPSSEAGIERMIDAIHASQENPLPREKLRMMIKGMQAAEKLDPIRTCPRVEQLWKTKSYNPPRIDNAFDFAEKNGGNYGFLYLRVTMPYADLDRGEAYFSASRVSGPLAGEGVDVMYVRNAAGRWKPSMESTSWIS